MHWTACFVPITFLAIQVDGLTTGIASLAAALAAAYGVYLKVYEGSFKQKLDAANRQIADNASRISVLERDRDFWKAEAEAARTKLAARDRTIEERDRTIEARDRALDEQIRVNHRIAQDVASLAEAFLVRKGDARPRKVKP